MLANVILILSLPCRWSGTARRRTRYTRP